MEYRFISIKKEVAYSFLILLFAGCGYFETDGIFFEKRIVGNIKLYQHKNSSEINLIFSRDSQHGKVIIQDCERIFYDSINKNIYIEGILNQYNSNYYKIKILDTKTTNSVEAYKVKEITKIMFDSLSSSQPLIFNKKPN